MWQKVLLVLRVLSYFVTKVSYDTNYVSKSSKMNCFLCHKLVPSTTKTMLWSHFVNKNQFYPGSKERQNRTSGKPLLSTVLSFSFCFVCLCRPSTRQDHQTQDQVTFFLYHDIYTPKCRAGSFPMWCHDLFDLRKVSAGSCFYTSCFGLLGLFVRGRWFLHISILKDDEIKIASRVMLDCQRHDHFDNI